MTFKMLKLKPILLILLFSYINSLCTLDNCPFEYGECIEDVCLCSSGYTTLELAKYNEDDSNFQYCNYFFKYRDYAIYLECAVPFGAGHFYTQRYFHGLIKFVLFWFISINIVLFKKKNIAIPYMQTIMTSLKWLFGIIYVVDYLGYNYNYYTDGYGIPLL
jgi:hypothetical protein